MEHQFLLYFVLVKSLTGGLRRPIKSKAVACDTVVAPEPQIEAVVGAEDCIVDAWGCRATKLAYARRIPTRPVVNLSFEILKSEKKFVRFVEPWNFGLKVISGGPCSCSNSHWFQIILHHRYDSCNYVWLDLVSYVKILFELQHLGHLREYRITYGCRSRVKPMVQIVIHSFPLIILYL